MNLGKWPQLVVTMFVGSIPFFIMHDSQMFYRMWNIGLGLFLLSFFSPKGWEKEGWCKYAPIRDVCMFLVCQVPLLVYALYAVVMWGKAFSSLIGG